MAAIARAELWTHLRSFPFWVTTLIAVALVAMAAWVGSREFNERWVSYRQQVRQSAADLDDLRTYSQLQPILVRPPEPLAVFDRGLEAQLGTDVRIHLYRVPMEASGGHVSNEFFVPIGDLDLTTVVKVVLGLLAVLLAFNSIPGDRESGLLRLLMLQGAGRGPVVLGKCLGILASLALALGLVTVTALACFFARAQIAFSAGQWLRIVALFGASLTYLSVMAMLSVLLSLYSRPSSLSLALAVGIWLISVFLLPEGTLLLARARARVEAEAGQDDAARIAALEWEHDRRLAEVWRQDPLRAEFSGHAASLLEVAPNGAVLRRYGSADYYDALAEYYRWETEEGRRFAAEVYQLRQGKETRLRRVIRRARRLAWLSPAFLLERLSQSLAGTSIDDHDRFLAACRDYRKAFIAELDRRGAFASWRWFTDDLKADHPWPGWLGLRPEEVPPDQAHALFNRLNEPEVAAQLALEQARFREDPSLRLALDVLPSFDYSSVSFAAAHRRVAPELLVFLALNLALWVAVYLRFMRYEVLP